MGCRLINRQCMPTGEQAGSWYVISDDDDCEHEPLHRLGADNGNNEYYQCQACETVLIKQGFVDHRQLRKQRDDQQQRSTNPFANALGVNSFVAPKDPPRHRPNRSTSSSTVVSRIKRVSRRLLRK